MIFTVERAALLDTVSRLQKVVGAKTSMPVLEGIMISAEQGRITLAAYNLEMGMKKEIYAKCDEPGDIVINAKLLSEILRRMNGIQVEIEADNRLMCHIKSGEAVFDIMGMAASDFPEMPSVVDGTKLSICGDILCDMVKGTIFAVAQSEGTRPILTGLNMSVKDGTLQLVAIDGYRLAIRRHKVEIDTECEFIITGKALNEAVKLIGEDTDTVDIIISNRLVSFNIDGYVFISRLLEGEFVNYEKIIPTEFTQRLRVNTGDIINTVERVSLLISETFTTPVRCVLDEDNIVFSSATSMGRATETFKAVLEGDPFEIGLNSRYLLDALRACDTEMVQIKFKGANSGVLILSNNDEENDFLYLIMPMRLK